MSKIITDLNLSPDQIRKLFLANLLINHILKHGGLPTSREAIMYSFHSQVQAIIQKRMKISQMVCPCCGGRSCKSLPGVRQLAQRRIKNITARWN